MPPISDLITRRSLRPAAANDTVYSWSIALDRRGPLPDASELTAAEQVFFLGAPLAHVLAYEEHLKARRLNWQLSRFARLR